MPVTSNRSGTTSITWKLLSSAIGANIEIDTDAHSSAQYLYAAITAQTTWGRLRAYEREPPDQILFCERCWTLPLFPLQRRQCHLRFEGRCVIAAWSSRHLLSPDPRQSSPLSGRNSTYRSVQNSEASSYELSNVGSKGRSRSNIPNSNPFACGPGRMGTR